MGHNAYEIFLGSRLWIAAGTPLIKGSIMNQSPPQNKAVFLLLFLTFLNVLNFVDRNLLASFAATIIPELELTEFEFTLLTGFVFVVFYMLMGLFMGVLADRLNRPRLIAAGLLLWSALTAASGAARNFIQLGAARIFVGVGEATLTPASISMLSDSFKPSQRSRVTSFYYAGIPLGAGLSLLVAGYLGPVIGWRSCFYILGGVGIVFSAALLWVGDPPRGAMEDVPVKPLAESQPTASFGETMGILFYALRRSPALLMTMVGGALVQFGVGAVVLDQRWLVVERDFDAAHAAQVFGWLFLGFGMVGNFVGGIGGDWMHARRSGGRLFFLACAQLIVIPFTVYYRFAVPESVPFYICAAVGSIAIMFFFGPTFSAIQDLVPIKIRATVIAFFILSINILGVAPGQTTAGYLATKFSEIDVEQATGFTKTIGEEPLTWALFIVASVGSLSIPLFFWAAARYQGDLDRLHAEFAEKAADNG